MAAFSSKLSHPGSKGRDLYTVYLDGSGIETYRCDHGHDRSAAFEAASGDIVFIAGDGSASPRRARSKWNSRESPASSRAGRPRSRPGNCWPDFDPLPVSPPASIAGNRVRGAGESPCRFSGAEAVQPVVIRPHEIPKRHPSSLGQS